MIAVGVRELEMVGVCRRDQAWLRKPAGRAVAFVINHISSQSQGREVNALTEMIFVGA